VPQHFVEDQAVGERLLESRGAAKASAEVGVLIDGEKDLLFGHRGESVLVALPFFRLAMDEICRIARKFKQALVDFHVGIVSGRIEGEIALMIDVEMTARLPIPMLSDAIEIAPAFFEEAAVQSTSDP